MGKAIGLMVVAMTGLGAAYVAPWDSILAPRDASPVKLDIISPPGRSTAPTVTSAGWRGLARPDTEARVGAALQPDAGRAAPVTVTIAPRVPEPAAKPTAAPSLAGDRFSLTRELQRELKRVGCYDGEVSGVWTPMTRVAMKAFTNRINAALPVEEPDVILLTLVQGHEDKACGRGCPSGQALAADGRCVPNAILSQSARKAPQRAAVIDPPNAPPSARAAPVITGWSTTTSTPPPPQAIGAAPVEGRMALAGPADSAIAAAQQAPVPGVTPPVRPATPPQARFGASFFKQLDRMGGN